LASEAIRFSSQAKHRSDEGVGVVEKMIFSEYFIHA
jgi:hypothetical protein